MSAFGDLLERRVAAVRASLRRRALRAMALWVGAGVALVGIAAWFGAGPDGWHPGSDVPAILVLAALLWLGVAAVAFVRLTRRRFEEGPLSDAIERAAGIRPGQLRGSLELAREAPRGVSPALVEHAVRGAVQDLGARGERELAGPLGEWVDLWIRRGTRALTAGAFALVVLAISSPTRAAKAWGGMASPIATMLDPVLPPIRVRPGTIEVMRGSDVRVEIVADGRAEVEIAWQAEGEVARRERLVVSEGAALFLFEDVTAPISYRVVAERGSETPEYRILPIDPLFISDLAIEILYPPHTGLAPEEYVLDAPPLTLPVGTRLAFRGRASRPLSLGVLVDTLGATALTMAVEEDAFEATWFPGRSGIFDWRFEDETGALAELTPEPLELRMVGDSVPMVSIPSPGTDTILPINLRQPLVIEARDDYGLRRLELVAYRVTSLGERMEPVIQALGLAGNRGVVARPVLDVNAWRLMPGDTVRYFARATDNAPGGQTGISREYILTMPEAEELRRAMEDQLEAAAGRLEELAEAAAEEADANESRALEAQAEARDQDPSAPEQAQAQFEQRQDLQQAIANQEQMVQQVDSLRAEMQALERTMQEAGQIDPAMAQQLEALQEMLRELAEQGMSEEMRRIEESLDRMDPSEASESFQRMADSQERLRESLERSLDRLEQAAMEQDMRSTTRDAQDLAFEERALADAMRENDRPELRAQQQEALTERAEALEERMRSLEERLREMGEEEAADQVEGARDRAEQAQAEMEQAQAEMEQAGQEQQAQAEEEQEEQAGQEEQAQAEEEQAGQEEQTQQAQAQAQEPQQAQGQPRERADEQAAQRAQQAAEQMQAAANQMSQAREEMQQRTQEGAQAAMRQAADDALSLARRQSELGERMEQAGREELEQMRSEQSSLQQGLENLAERLEQANEAAGQENQELSSQIQQAREQMQQTMQAMEQPAEAPQSPSAEASEAVGELNQLAMMAIGGAQQIGQPGQAAGNQGDRMQQAQEQLGQLAQQQGQVMNQSGGLVPMQLGDQAMQQQLQDLASGQRSVSQGLGSLSEEPGTEGVLGDVQAMAEEAERLARQLEEGRLTPEIVQRQERLFHRLLDAGRSLEREEFTEEREARQPGAFERGAISELSEEQLGAVAFEVLDGAELQQLTPAMRQLVLEYFERLNREGGTGGGAR